MANRSTFLYHRVGVISEGGTQEGRYRRVLDVPVQAGRRGSLANPRARDRRDAMGRPQGHKRTDPTLPRKAS